MAFARTVLHTKTLLNPSTGSEDKVYGDDYVSATSHSEAVSGADVGGIPYCPTATTETTSANLTYDQTNFRLQIGSGSAASAGWIAGFHGSSGYSAIWSTKVVPSSSNYVFATSSDDTHVGGAVNLYLQAANVAKVTINSTAGSGPTVTMGTATTDVGARLTQTWNAGGVAFNGWKFTITDTASAAGSLAAQILGGASGTTSLFKVTKGGQVDAPSYAVAGAAGADFGPGLPTSITVVKGIVTAIS